MIVFIFTMICYTATTGAHLPSILQRPELSIETGEHLSHITSPFFIQAHGFNPTELTPISSFSRQALYMCVPACGEDHADAFDSYDLISHIAHTHGVS